MQLLLLKDGGIVMRSRCSVVRIQTRALTSAKHFTAGEI